MLQLPISACTNTAHMFFEVFASESVSMASFVPTFSMMSTSTAVARTAHGPRMDLPLPLRRR